ncbi:MAG: mechanosensitive ion channel family protein [Oscillospiraceae bacterium]|nr:mechanosensitive ion channel family protein [Oscillospiraceae bacterium]
MNNKTEKRGVGKFIALIIILAVIVALINPSYLTFLPEETRTAISAFNDAHYAGSALAGLGWQDILAAVFVLFASWVVANIVKFIVGCFKFKKRRSETIRHLVANLFKYVIYIVGVVVALGCLGVDTTAMFVSVGVVGIVVGFGAQSLIEDVITGLFIIFEGEFQVGDIITIDGFRGEVKTIGLRTVSIIDNGGNIRIINNSEISSLVNLSEVTSAAVVNVPVSYEDSLETAENAVKEALTELPSEYPDIFKEAPIYRGVDVLAETHIELQVLAKVAEENIYTARRIMQREIKISCEKAGLAVPCQS